MQIEENGKKTQKLTGREPTKGNSIDYKIFDKILKTNALKFTDFGEMYVRENEDERGEMLFQTFYKWFIRGMKVRKFMRVLAVAKHSLVIVPVGTTVTVESGNGQKRVIENMPKDKVAVFSATMDNNNFLDVEVVGAKPPQFRKRRGGSGQVISVDINSVNTDSMDIDDED